MTYGNKIYLAFFLCFLFAGDARAQDANTAANAGAEATVAEPEPHSMTRVSVDPWVVEGEILGVVAVYVYDDVTTKRPADYWEIYDQDGELLAIGWFDHLGIQRTAVDRGILEEKGQLEGIFVVVTDGEAA